MSEERKKPVSLLHEPIVIDVLMRACKVCNGPFGACDCDPPLVVTRNGVPCPDQKAALKEFWDACQSRETPDGGR